MRLLTVLIVLTVGASRGCHEAHVSGEQTVYQFSTTVRLLVVLIPGMLLLGSIALAIYVARTRIWACVFGGLAALFLVLFTPGVFQAKVWVTPTGLWEQSGFWFSPGFEGFEYKAVNEVSIETHEVRARSIGRSGSRTRTEVFWVVHHRDDFKPEFIGPSDLWLSASDEIVPKLESYGVRVVDRRKRQ